MKFHTASEEPLLEIQHPSLNHHHFTHTDEHEQELEDLPAPVLRNIETIIELETEHGRKIPAHQRAIERIATYFGQPEFLYVQIIAIGIWWFCSHLSAIDVLPHQMFEFDFQEDALDVGALLISSGVLVYQSRQEKIAEERSHLMLQIDLLAEQKIGKIISLIEELRRDLPNVHDRHDAEAEQMQSAIDPQALLTALKESLAPEADDDDDNEKVATAPPVDPKTLLDPNKAPAILPTHLG